MKFIKEAWRGEKTLVFTYWVIGVVSGIVLNFVAIYLEVLMTNDQDNAALLLFSLIFALFFFTYIIFATVAIWRSAGKYIEDANSDLVIGASSPFWGHIARFMVILGWGRGIIALF